MAKQAQQQRQASHLWASRQAWRQQIKPAAGLAGTSPHDDYDVDNDDKDNHENHDVCMMIIMSMIPRRDYSQVKCVRRYKTSDGKSHYDLVVRFDYVS